MRADVQASAVRLCSAAKYRSAGTVEFLVDQDTGAYYFLEVGRRWDLPIALILFSGGGEAIGSADRLRL